ncbi:hypothetical protein PM8797T_08224 [Gimesia maris DSM 8797]|nr:hypothetical protein PM8797T_08224 [Gimesia maris DSM 8797]
MILWNYEPTLLVSCSLRSPRIAFGATRQRNYHYQEKLMF